VKYSIHGLQKNFSDFETSDLILGLIQEAEETETLDRPISVDPWPEEEEYFSSDGHSRAEQQAEAKKPGVTAYRVADEHYTWDMGLVRRRD